MKLKDLRRIVAAQPAANDDLEVLVWLPGSRIALGDHMTTGPASTANTPERGVALLIEGNLTPGSVLG